MARDSGTVLIVHDDARTVSVCRKELEGRGYKVCVCGEAGLVEGTARRVRPAVVLVDGRLASGDVRKACNGVREGLGAGVLVVLPPRAGPGEAAAWGECCDGLLAQPLRAVEVGEAVAGLLRRGSVRSSGGGDARGGAAGGEAGEAPVDEIGGCRLERVLGRGGMGTVYLGWHVLLKAQVAVKLVPISAAGWSDDGLEGFLCGARAAAGMEHAHVVPVLNAGCEGGFYYLVQRYVEGRSLREVVEDGGRLCEAGVRRLLLEVGSALEAVHARGMVHCDVKPGNILVRPDGGALLTDFGLALRAQTDVGAREGMVTGTPLFMSPEQCEGLRPDGRADLYSLGATAYYAATGRAPVSGATLSGVLRGHLTEEPASVRAAGGEVSEELEGVVMRLLAKSPEERFASARALLEALEGPG